MRFNFVPRSFLFKAARHRLGLTFALIIGLLVLVDRVAGPLIRSMTIEPPLLLTTGQNSQNILKFWELTRSGIEPIVFTGDSQMREDFAPTLFDQKVAALSGRPVTSLNISVLGAGTTVSRDVIKNLLLARGVHTIFYGIDMRALKSGSDLDDLLLRDFEESPLGYALSRPPGLEQNVLLWLLEHSTLFQYRNNFRRWLTGQLPNNARDNIDEWGHQALDGVNTRDPASITLQYIPFETNDRLLSALSEIMDACQQTRNHCILINMPLHSQSEQVISKPDEAHYREIVFGMAKRAHLPVWDFNTPDCRTILGGDAVFFDLNHLNSDGAQKFTETLADLYVQTLNSQPGQVADRACPSINQP